MKKIILLLLILSFNLTSYAQTDLDVLLYYKICEYRAENNLTCWKWDNKAWKVAKSHSIYQSKTGYMGHDGGSKIRRYAGQRFTYYNIDWHYVGENCAVANTKGMDMAQTVNRIMAMWKASPAHNELLLSTNAKFAGVSCIIGTEYKWSHNYYYWTYATLNVYRQ